ncbi:related to tRNA (adenine-N(1)-)-methyltransferase [Lecanosticta acicola]|uniref:tRNA (adenine(58)-N(1))-methyltransferase catalytic subunit TRM61 n=1 Tax=Lecanosticta acicola TaxID=111012 RepID=A0AAI8Z368_9PEZI|nr:related to tRNA (adenine-N(1)-)-methyltransferase [Lecanosticta acicola]
MRPSTSWIATPHALRSSLQRRHVSDGRLFQAGDLVLLREKHNRSTPPILSRPLEQGKRIEGHRGVILHDDVIGRRVRDVVKSHTPRSQRDGTEYRLHNVTLDEYVRLTKRLVTPIYPADANLIVSLLDLHADESMYGPDADQRLEILEAGTGHGGLTLHLSRAIHAANSSARLSSNVGASVGIDEFRSRRRAVVHTTDVSPLFSAHAETVVKGFRRGFYAMNVDFHVGDVGDTLKKLYTDRDDGTYTPFLSHALLDLPAAEGHLAKVAEALKTDGTLIVFNPSITQIMKCVTKVKDEGILLDLDRVVELGVNGGSGGREWDIRFIRPKSLQKRATAPDDVHNISETSAASEDEVESVGGSSTLHTPVSDEDQHWSTVCRPKVGERITGGGFLGVWKKQRDMRFGLPLPEASIYT